MSILSGILGNKVIVNSLMGQLKGIITDQKLDCIIVRLDTDGGLLIDMYKPGEVEIKVAPGVEVLPEIINPEIGQNNADNQTDGDGK